MNLMFSGDFAKHLLAMTKKDDKLAYAMARQFVSSVEPSSIASYLLTVDVAIELLATRIKKNPVRTIEDLQTLPTLEIPLETTRRKKPGRPARTTRVLKDTPVKRRKRRRLSAAQIDKIKNAISVFLKQHPGSNRKQIVEAVSFPSVAAYNRIMSERKKDKNIISQGEKSKTRYTIKGIRVPKSTKVMPRAKTTPKTKVKSKAKTRTKAAPAKKIKTDK